MAMAVWLWSDGMRIFPAHLRSSAGAGWNEHTNTLNEHQPWQRKANVRKFGHGCRRAARRSRHHMKMICHAILSMRPNSKTQISDPFFIVIIIVYIVHCYKQWKSSFNSGNNFAEHGWRIRKRLFGWLVERVMRWWGKMSISFELWRRDRKKYGIPKTKPCLDDIRGTFSSSLWCTHFPCFRCHLLSVMADTNDKRKRAENTQNRKCDLETNSLEKYHFQ